MSFSETVGFQINGPNKKMLFIPDIDKWEKWQHNIVEQVKTADYALLDATFYKDGELQGRAMSEVPHPFVEETMNLLPMSPLLKRKNCISSISIIPTSPVGSECSKSCAGCRICACY
ncbi:MAG: MBL fold metallo-hydrolase [Saprospiraceae bacterium]